MTASAAADPSPGAADYLAYAQAGDAAALERALRACADRAYTQARRHLGNAADADDAVQEACLQLARDGRRFDGRVPFAVWVARRVQVACLRLRRCDRRRRRREQEALAMPPPVPADPERAETVRALVARLPAADQAAIDLHYFAGLSQAEVATALAVSENAVALRLSRARTRLRDLLGGSATAASVALLLAAQPVHAASPAVLSGIGSLSATLAVGGALPSTTIPLSLSQKGLLLMSTHPLATALCAGLLLLAGLVPAVLWSADPPPPPAPRPVPAAAAEQPWQGKARALLPFIDPQAPVQAAVDWEFLRRQAATTKPTSLLVDPRAQPALAHIREQSRLWSLDGSGTPDLAALLMQMDGAVFAIGRQPQPGVCFVAELGETGARAAQGLFEQQNIRRGSDRGGFRGPSRPVETIGTFTAIEVDTDEVTALSGSRWAVAHRQALQVASARTQGPPPPPVPVAMRIGLADLLAAFAALDAERSDPLGLAAWFGPDWRTAQPVLDTRMERVSDHWRTTTAITGLAGLPLRPAAPAIAGCVPTDALASLVLGLDLERALALGGPLLGDEARPLLRALGKAGLPPERLRAALSGDLAVVVQPQAPFPTGTVVLGLRPAVATTLAPELAPALARWGLVPTTVPGSRAAWSGATPAGMLTVLLSDDRLVLSTGEASAFLAPPPRPVTAAVELDADLPALARTWLPLLFAMVDAQPAWLQASGGPLRDLLGAVRGIGLYDGLRGDGAQTRPPLDLDAVLAQPAKQQASINNHRYDQHAHFRNVWGRFTGRPGLPMQPHLAIYVSQRSDSRQPTLVVRTARGWRAFTDYPFTIETFAEATALRRRLDTWRLAAGTPPENLQILDLPEPPSFDRRWLPPPAVVADHLPAYRLRLESLPDGVRLTEDGVPLACFYPLAFTAWLQASPGYQSRFHGQAILRRDGPALEQKHRQALAALRRAHQALAARWPEGEPLLQPSALLAAAGVPLAELASLTGGTPPTAAQVDALGFFHPSGWANHHAMWVIPLEKGLYLEMAWWARGAEITGTPQAKLRQPTAEEIEQVKREWRERNPAPRRKERPAPPPAPAPPPPPSDF